MQRVDATNVDKFKSPSKNQAVAVQQRELLAGGHIQAGDKGGLFTLQAPPSPRLDSLIIVFSHCGRQPTDGPGDPPADHARSA